MWVQDATTEKLTMEHTLNDHTYIVLLPPVARDELYIIYGYAYHSRVLAQKQVLMKSCGLLFSHYSPFLYICKYLCIYVYM